MIAFPITVAGTKTTTATGIELAVTITAADSTLVAQRTFTFSSGTPPLHVFTEIWRWLQSVVFEQMEQADIPASFSIQLRPHDLIGGL